MEVRGADNAKQVLVDQLSQPWILTYDGEIKKYENHHPITYEGCYCLTDCQLESGTANHLPTFIAAKLSPEDCFT